MLALDFFTWWYDQGWRLLARNAQKRMAKTVRMFSVPILLRTLFAPWRRIVTYPGASFDAHIRAFLDNLVSRAVGFTVRIFVLLAAVIGLAVVSVVVVVELIVWPLVPLATIAAIAKGLVG
jgi:hypothetical protein